MTKRSKTRGFHPRGTTEKRIEHLEKLGVNISEFLNEVMDQAMEPFYRTAIANKEKELRKLLGSAP